MQCSPKSFACKLGRKCARFSHISTSQDRKDRWTLLSRLLSDALLFWFCAYTDLFLTQVKRWRSTKRRVGYIFLRCEFTVNSRVYRANLHVYISSDTEGKTFGLPAAIAILSIMVVVNRETHSNPLDKCQVKWSYQLKAIFGAMRRARDSGFSPLHRSWASFSGQGIQCPQIADIWTGGNLPISSVCKLAPLNFCLFSDPVFSSIRDNAFPLPALACKEQCWICKE